MNFNCGPDIEMYDNGSSLDTRCKILGEEDSHYLLEDIHKTVSKIHVSLIHDNLLEIVDNHIELTRNLYLLHFRAYPLNNSKKAMNKLFVENIKLIFTHRQIVLSNPEYFYLAPSILKSGGAYIGGFSYSLGALFKAFEDGYFYYDEIAGFKKLYIVSISGSPLSGTFYATCWSDETHEIVKINGWDISPRIPFFKRLTEFKKIVEGSCHSYGDVAMEQLINEIKASIEN
jgi:hypothetical protein